MNVKTRIKLLLIHFCLLSSCANQTFKQQIVTNMAIGAAVGLLVGAGEKDYKKEHAIMYAGIASSGASLATIYLSNSDSEADRLRAQIAKIQTDFDAATNPQIEASSTGLLSSKIPEKYKSMINPGEWKIYSLDQWIEDGENRLIHQDKMMELNPPSLKPISLPQVKNRK